MESHLDITLIPLQDKYIEELSQMLAEAYMANNPFIEPLKLTLQQMVSEFQQNLQSGQFKHFLLFADKQKYEKGEVEILGCWCWGDIVDFFPKGDLSYETTDFNIVPSADKVRLYMRYMSIKPIYQLNIKPGEYLYCGNLAVKKGYQGRGLSYQIYYLSYINLLKLGYTKYAAHAINKITQEAGRKSALLAPEQPFDVSNMYVQDTKTKPFEGLNLQQILFQIDIQATKEKLEQMFNS